MHWQPAKVLEPDDVRRLLAHVRQHRYPHRDRVLLLSFKAGLRACEMAGLSWSMVLNTQGEVADHLSLARSITKNATARRIPIHKLLGSALARLHAQAGHPRDGPVIRFERGAHMTPRSIVNWFAWLYFELELAGCSSYSGRRTFVTQAARLVAKTRGSLRDVQELAGHKAITTTERYIEGNRLSQRRLIGLL